MKVEECRYVTMRYTMTLDDGQVADRSPEDEPFGFIFGASQIFPALEEKLRGLEPASSATVVLTPDEGYGEHQPNLVKEIPLATFPKGEPVEVGLVFEARSPVGTVPFYVRNITGGVVFADFNPPLAGERLHFEVQIEDVRELTPGEIQVGPAVCKLRRPGR